MLKQTALAVALISSFAVPAMATDFFINSQAIRDGQPLAKAQVGPTTFGCDGGNISPDVSWSNAPASTKSFVVSLNDPDAPTGSGFWHWVVYNIPAYTTGLPVDAGSGKGLPKGAVQAPNDASVKGFMGACPPPGSAHHYILTVKALDVSKLELPKNATPALIGFMSNAHTIAKASITGTYAK